MEYFTKIVESDKNAKEGRNHVRPSEIMLFRCDYFTTTLSFLFELVLVRKREQALTSLT